MPKTSLKTLAYNTIKEKIITCEYAPGSLLNEESLTDMLKISRTPIRDALGRLEQEGLIEILPKKGIMVTNLSMPDINMIFEIRQMYEPYVLEHYGSRLDDDKLTEFYHHFSNPKNMDTAALNASEYYHLDDSFHSMIMEICPNIYLRKNYDLIRNQVARFRYMTGQDAPVRREETFKEHIEVITACLQKDYKLAAQKMQQHLDESKKATFRLAFETMMAM